MSHGFRVGGDGLVAPGAFGVVERVIRAVQQVVEARRLVGVGDAEADGDWYLVVLGADGNVSDDGLEAGCDDVGPFGVDAGQQDHELVTAEAGDEIRRPDTLAGACEVPKPGSPH
jgi:hypothetical protein